MTAGIRFLANVFVTAAISCALAAHAQTVVAPLPVTGPYPVACTNVEQDFSRVASGETPEMYWRGSSGDGKERYVDALLTSPAGALTATFTAPGDADLFDRWAGKPVTYVFIACYPTSPDNTRADYVLPRGTVVPKMQRGNEAPILPAGTPTWPVLLYSHGYAGSPLETDYLRALTAFASWGYVAVAPFHGDLRYSVFGPSESAALATKLYVPIWSEFVAMQAIRPLSLSAGLDLLLARPEWQGRIDTSRVGAFGISQGGETLMLLGGAQLNYDIFTFATRRVTQDTRVRAAVGYIPYFGIDSVPAFGKQQAGAQGVSLPYLALSGADDPIAPADLVHAGLDGMTGPRGQVLLDGMGHELDAASSADTITWSLGFLAAWVNGDAAVRSTLTQVVSVDGGLDDHKVLYVDPGGGGVPGDVLDTIEFYNASLDHYFITAFPEEAAALDAGSPSGWTRTGYRFRTWKAGSGPGKDACRFYGTPGLGPNTHFYTVSDYECGLLKADPTWTFEAYAFRAIEPVAGVCAAEYATVTRLYNNGLGAGPNHRYLTDPAAIEATVARGWLVEGPVFCVPR